MECVGTETPGPEADLPMAPPPIGVPSSVSGLLSVVTPTHNSGSPLCAFLKKSDNKIKRNFCPCS